MIVKNLLVTSLLVFLSSITIPAQWSPVSSGTTNNLNGLYFLNTGIGYAVGDAGTILKSTDAGLNWNTLTSGTSNNLYDAYFLFDNLGVVVGDAGLILRTTDGGTTWNTITSGVSDALLSVSFSGVYGIIGGSSQTILYSTDSGINWQISQSGFFGGGFWGAYMLNATTGFVSGQNSIFQPLVGKSTDEGVNWDFYNFYFQSNEGRCDDIFFFDANTGVVSGILWDGQGAIARTINSGTDWTTTLFSSGVQGMDFPTFDIGFAVGWSGIILNTIDSGISWTQQASGTSVNLSDVDFTGNALNGIAVGEGGVILVTNNGGIPVELTSFTADVNKNNIELKWSTATETNNQGFKIERKAFSNSKSELQNSNWEQIAFVNGHGTTSEPRYYSFTDESVQPGKYQYRLKQIDFDGSFEYSNAVEAEVISPGEFTLNQNYPNPFNPSTKINFTLASDSRVTLKVFNILGKETATLIDGNYSAGLHDVDFNAYGLNSGIYLYRIEALTKDGVSFTQVRKMILLK